MKKLSKAAVFFALSFFSVFAHEHAEKPSLSEQLGIEKYGELSATAYLYFQENTDRQDNSDAQNFGLARVDLGFETAKWNGFQAGVTGVFNASLSDRNDTYKGTPGADGVIADDASLAELWVSYDITEKTKITGGRIVREYVMLDDYFEGVFIESDEIDGFNLKLSAVNNAAVYDIDEVTKWEELSEGNDFGVLGAELTFNGVEGLEVTGVYYTSEDTADIYGGQVVYGFDISEEVSNETTAMYFVTNERTQDDNAGVWALSNTVSLNELDLTAGYIQSDEDAGSGSILNNPWDPFFEDNKADSADAGTWYLQADWAVTEKLGLTALYGETDSDTGNARELNLVAGYEILEGLALEAAYIHLDTTSEEGYDLVYGQLSYEF